MRPHPHLLEISAWPWLERLSREERRLVTLADVPARCWDRIADDGFDYVFLMGVWRRSAIGREIARTDPGLIAEYDRVLPGWTDADVAGSPYCIQAYEPDERMGGWRGLDAARRQLHERGVVAHARLRSESHGIRSRLDRPSSRALCARLRGGLPARAG